MGEGGGDFEEGRQPDLEKHLIMASIFFFLSFASHGFVPNIFR